jgi:hypothetical protein
MSDLAVWLALLAVAVVALAVTRFNPAVIYSRVILIRLGVVVVLVIGAALVLGFFRPPDVSPSGVTNLDGG